jgi:hypothetical protein
MAKKARPTSLSIQIHPGIRASENLFLKNGVPIDKMNYFWSITSTDSVAGPVIL